jgi:hypothetical protein
MRLARGFDYRILPTKDGVALPQLTLVDRWMSIRQTKAEAPDWLKM